MTASFGAWYLILLGVTSIVVILLELRGLWATATAGASPISCRESRARDGCGGARYGTRASPAP